MALSIKNRELEEVSRELARVTGKPITEALLEGAKRELLRQKQIRAFVPKDEMLAKVRKIQDRVAKLPILDNRPIDEILDDIYGFSK